MNGGIAPEVGANMMSHEDAVSEFSHRWQALGGLFYRATSRAAVIEALQQAWGDLVDPIVGPMSVVASMPPPFREWDLSAVLPVHESVTVTRWDGQAAMRSASARAVLGITGAAWAVADTGSVALYGTPDAGLLPSVLPPSHLMLVQENTIVATVADGLRLLSGQRIPPLMKIVTGPSMTADIEGTLVTGVHGPGKVGVIVYTGDIQ